MHQGTLRGERGDGSQSLLATLSQHFVVTLLFLCHGPAPAPAAPDADFSLRKGFVFSFSSFSSWQVWIVQSGLELLIPELFELE